MRYYYDKRQEVKAALKELKNLGLEGTREWDELKKEDIFYKLILNNAYGKFAQNPAKYKEHYITDVGEKPPTDAMGGWGDFASIEAPEYWLWARPNPSNRFNNVGTGASITGAARANLLETIHLSGGVLYCDTDSVICNRLPDIDLHPTRLGAWDIEKEMSSVVIAGKKLYGYRERETDKETIRAKGASGLKYQNLVDIISRGYDFENSPLISVAKGVTINKRGEQTYLERRIRATARQEGKAYAR